MVFREFGKTNPINIQGAIAYRKPVAPFLKMPNRSPKRLSNGPTARGPRGWREVRRPPRRRCGPVPVPVRKRDRSYSKYAGRAPGRSNGSGDCDPWWQAYLQAGCSATGSARPWRGQERWLRAIKAQPVGSGGLDLAAPWVTIAARATLTRGPRPQAFDFSGGSVRSACSLAINGG